MLIVLIAVPVFVMCGPYDSKTVVEYPFESMPAVKSSVPSSEYSRHVHGRECRKMFWYFYDTLFMWLLGWATPCC